MPDLVRRMLPSYTAITAPGCGGSSQLHYLHQFNMHQSEDGKDTIFSGVTRDPEITTSFPGYLSRNGAEESAKRIQCPTWKRFIKYALWTRVIDHGHRPRDLNRRFPSHEVPTARCLTICGLMIATQAKGSIDNTHAYCTSC